MKDYKDLCLAKINTMDVPTYSRYCVQITAAQKGEISWECLWKTYLKDASRVSLRG